MNDLDVKYNKPLLLCFALLTGVFLLLPALFTGFKLGWFTPEPEITTPVLAKADAPVLKMVADGEFKPRTYINKKGEWAGADIEIAIEAANRLGMRPEVTFSDWMTARDALIADKAKVILGLEIFSNMAGADKTVPILNDKLEVYGRTEVKDAASLAGKRVALMARSVIMAVFNLNCEYVQYYTNKDILQALEDGKVDFAICHKSVADNIIKDNGFKLKQCFTLLESYPSLGVRASEQELKAKLNEVLLQMAADGTMQKTVHKWMTHTENLTLTEVLHNNQDVYYLYLLFFIIMEAMFFIYVQKERNHRKQMILIRTSHTDKLTGLLNRYAYEKDLLSYSEKQLPDNLVFVLFDVNGLKQANDSLGHAAGDELLIGAAGCIGQCFGGYGRVYRIGGDEFAALIFADDKQLELLQQDFAQLMEQWTGTLVKTLSIAAGYVRRKEMPDSDVRQMIMLADKRMYVDKAACYAKLGMDRRRS